MATSLRSFFSKARLARSAMVALSSSRNRSLAQSHYALPRTALPERVGAASIVSNVFGGNFNRSRSYSTVVDPSSGQIDLTKYTSPHTKAMAVGMKEYPNSYVFIIDMPGVKPSNITMYNANDKVLCISGEREVEEKDVVKYRRMEKFSQELFLPENANEKKISCQLTVTVEKLQPNEYE